MYVILKQYRIMVQIQMLDVGFDHGPATCEQCNVGWASLTLEVK